MSKLRPLQPLLGPTGAQDNSGSKARMPIMPRARPNDLVCPNCVRAKYVQWLVAGSSRAVEFAVPAELKSVLASVPSASSASEARQILASGGTGRRAARRAVPPGAGGGIYVSRYEASFQPANSKQIQRKHGPTADNALRVN